jgi:hypothetical protein
LNHTDHPELIAHEKKKDTINGTFFFITVNCDPTKTNPAKLIKITTKKMPPFAKEMYFTIEYFTKEGMHPHLHIALRKFRPCEYGRAKKATRTFIHAWFCKKYEDFITGAGEKVHVRPSYDERWYMRKVKYVQGIKSKVKMPYVLKDQIWRIENGFQDYYHFMIGQPYSSDIIPYESNKEEDDRSISEESEEEVDTTVLGIHLLGQSQSPVQEAPATPTSDELARLIVYPTLPTFAAAVASASATTATTVTSTGVTSATVPTVSTVPSECPRVPIIEPEVIEEDRP